MSNHFKFIFVCECSNFIIFHVACPVFPSPLVEETVFSPQCIFASFLIDELTIGMSGLNLI